MSSYFRRGKSKSVVAIDRTFYSASPCERLVGAEENRAYAQKILSYQKMEEMGIISPVLSVEADFLRMVRFGGNVLIRAVITEYNGIKLAVSYQVIDKSTNMVQCKGVTKHCFLNEQGRPISLKKSYPEIHKLFEKEFVKGKRMEKKRGDNENNSETEKAES